MDKVTFWTMIGALATSLGVLITVYLLVSSRFKKSFKDSVVKTIREENDKQAVVFNDEIKKLTDELKIYKEATADIDKKLRNSSLALARDRIHQAYTHFIPKGTIDEHTLFCIVELSKAYAELGGNTFVKDEVEELKKMYADSIKHKPIT